MTGLPPSQEKIRFALGWPKFAKSLTRLRKAGQAGRIAAVEGAERRTGRNGRGVEMSRVEREKKIKGKRIASRESSELNSYRGETASRSRPSRYFLSRRGTSPRYRQRSNKICVLICNLIGTSLRWPPCSSTSFRAPPFSRFCSLFRSTDRPR